MSWHRRMFLLSVLLLSNISQSAKCASSEDRIVVAISFDTNVVCPNAAVGVLFEVRNTSTSPIRIIPPRLGSMDLIDEANASVTVIVTSPDGKQAQIRYGRPYVGPMKEIDYVPVNEIALQPKDHNVTRLYLTGSWKQGAEQPLFEQEGQYSVAFTYYPFVTNSGGRRILDQTRSVNVPATTIKVNKATADDVACWQEIRKLNRWWVVYDPEQRNIGYIPSVERKVLADDLTNIGQRHGNSSFRQYLDYASASLRLAKIGQEKAGDPDAIQTMETLAGNSNFVYRALAEQTRDKFRKQ